MIYLTQLIYLNQGQESPFDRFEEVAMPAIKKYHGQLLLRVRPGEDAFIAGSIDRPYEIHLVSFEKEQDFQNFQQDPDRQTYLHLKEQSVKNTFLVKGTRLG